MTRRQRPFVLWAAALAIILLVLLHESLFGGKGLVPADGILPYAPWHNYSPPGNYLLIDQYATLIPEHDFMHQQVMQGRFPLWNPYLACGIPNPASMQAATWFPIQLLASFLDPFYASGPAAFLKLFLAGLFMMVYLRVLGVSDAGAFLSGLVFSLCGFMIVWLGHPHVNCAMWLPLLLYFMEKTLRSTAQLLAHSNLRVWTGFSITYGLMILGGHPPTVVQISIFLFIYYLLRLFNDRLTNPFFRIGMFFCFLSAGVLLAAPQVVPYLEYYVRSSSSSSSDAMQRWAWHLTPGMLVHFLFPFITGSPADGYEDLSWLIGPLDTANFNERTAYVGILPLLFAAFGVFFRRDQFTGIFSGTILIALAWVLGFPPFPTIVSHLPVLEDINNMRLLLLVAFSVAVLAGLGWDAFNQSDDRKKVVRIAAGFLLLVGGLLCILGWNVATKLHTLDSAHRIYVSGQFLVALGSLIMAGFMLVKLSSNDRWLRTLLVLGWTAIDLLVFARGYNPAITHDRYYPNAPAIEWLQKDRSSFRILGLGNALIADTASIYGLSDARGSDFMNVRRYEELVTGGTGNFWFYRDTSVLPESLRLLNVKYVLSPVPLLHDAEDLELVFTNGVNIYRYKKFIERALPVFDWETGLSPNAILTRVRNNSFDPAKTMLLEESPATLPSTNTVEDSATNATVEIVSYQPDEVKIEAQMPRPSFLLLLDTYFPGWVATVNGRTAHIYRADYNFRAVSLAEGRSTICFTYRPWSLRVGIELSAASLLVLGAIWFWLRKNHHPE